MTKLTALRISDPDHLPVPLSFHPRLTLPIEARRASVPTHAPIAGDVGTDLDARLCFVAGTRLITREGRLAVEKIKEGDLVWTLENGFQTVRSIGRQKVRLSKSCFLRRPVVLRKDALRPGAPLRDIRVSPRVKFLVDDWINEPDLNEAGNYVTASQLIEQDRAERDLYCKSVTYFFITFDAPQVVETEGLLSHVPSAVTISVSV